MNALTRAVDSEFGGDYEFWREVARSAKNGDGGCLKLIASRLVPPLRAESECVQLDLDLDSATAALKDLLKQTVSGAISTTQCRDLAAVLNDSLAAEEISEMNERLRALQERIQ